MTSATGMTAYLSVKGRPYRGRVCCFGETVLGLDPLQAKNKSHDQMGQMDQDLALVSENEVVRCKAVRKTGAVRRRAFDECSGWTMTYESWSAYKSRQKTHGSTSPRIA